VTSVEFVEYRTLFQHERDEETKQRTRWEFYAARIVAEIRRSWVKDPSKVNEDVFLINFLTTAEAVLQRQEEEEKKKQIDPKLEAEKALAVEKASWGIISGRYLKKKSKGKKNGRLAGTSNTRRSSNPKRK
jgi:hypothetical protein